MNLHDLDIQRSSKSHASDPARSSRSRKEQKPASRNPGELNTTWPSQLDTLQAKFFRDSEAYAEDPKSRLKGIGTDSKASGFGPIPEWDPKMAALGRFHRCNGLRFYHQVAERG